MVTVPEGFLRFGRWQREGEAGRAWLDALPGVVDALCARWGLAVDDGPVLHGYNGVVVPVRYEGAPAMLKVSWQEESTVGEALALATWNGRGAVRLLRSDAAAGALLLERLDHRRALSGVPLPAAVDAAGALLRRLAVPAPDGLPAFRAPEMAASFHARWEELGEPFPRALLDRATALAAAIGPGHAGLLVNHDLHYDNVLAGGREPWLAVDPKVVAGDPEYQVAQLLWTRLDEMAGEAEVRRHVAALVRAAGLDAELARAWTVVRCVDYLLWGLAAGFTEDPVRCRTIADALSGGTA
jgi:streptomycin 6-kinase